GKRGNHAYSKIQTGKKYRFWTFPVRFFVMRYAGLLLALVCLPAFSQDPRYVNKLAPYVASPVKVVDLMLEMARIKPGETVYDLGSGDGRIVIAAAEKYKVK